MQSRLSSALKQKSREKVGIKIWKSRDYWCKKVGKVGLFQVQNLSK